MIEVYTKGKKKDKIEGYIDGKRYLTRKKKLYGYLEENIAKDKDGYPLLVLQADGKITYNEDWDYEEQGYIRDLTIYSLDNTPVFSLRKDKGEIYNHQNEEVYYLRGDNVDRLSDSDFFGIAAIHLELFAGGVGSDNDDDFDFDD